MGKNILNVCGYLQIMKNRSHLTINILLKLLVISIFFDSYAIIYVYTFPITIFSLVSALIIISGFFKCISNGTLILNISGKIAVVMILFIIINYFVTGCVNVTSPLLGIFYFVTFIFAYSSESIESFESYIRLFQKGINIMAIYGIYQLIARIFSLPLANIIIPNHMVTGFNWSNVIYIAGYSIQRSNAIFREPSFFSQYLAINILLYIGKVLKKSNSTISLILIVINAIALIVSFSGTGFIILLFSGLIYLIIIKKDQKIILRIIKYAIPVGIIALIFINMTIGRYFLSRLSEIFVYKVDNVSGYVRFRSGMVVLMEAWNQNWLFGVGIGTASEYLNTINNYVSGMTLNGFYRPAVEMGFSGMCLWILFILSFWKKRNLYFIIQILLCVLFPFMVCHETFMSNYYWLILNLLNIKIINSNYPPA